MVFWLRHKLGIDAAIAILNGDLQYLNRIEISMLCSMNVGNQCRQNEPSRTLSLGDESDDLAETIKVNIGVMGISGFRGHVINRLNETVPF